MKKPASSSSPTTTELIFAVAIMVLLGVGAKYLTTDARVAELVPEVPQRRPPHLLQMDQIPDERFIATAGEAVNLIASYTPETAKSQFEATRPLLSEPALTQFNRDMMTSELHFISESGRSQKFIVDPTLTLVDRESDPEKVVVRIAGARQKTIGGRPLPSDGVAFYLDLSTDPTASNKFGLVITDIKLRLVSSDTLAKEDERVRAATR